MPDALGNYPPSPTEPGSSTASTHSRSIIYRYIYTDVDDEIIQTQEDTKPLKFTSSEKTSILTDQTVFEVITTKKSRTRKDLAARSEGSSDSYEAPSKENTQTHIRIHSLYLINALRDVLNKQWAINLDLDVVKVQQPYQALIYHQEDLVTYKTRHPPGHSQLYVQTCNYHIDLLLGFLDDTFGKELRLERQRHQKSPPMATFKYLWLLFKPGNDVFVNETSTSPLMPMTVFKVDQSGNSIRPTFIGSSPFGMPFAVSCWRIQATAANACSPVRYSIAIDPFEGEKEICSLPIFPKEYMRDYRSLESQFIARGKRWFGVRNLAYKQYSGPTVGEPKINIQGRVVIDSESYYNDSEFSRQPERDLSRQLEMNGMECITNLNDKGCGCKSCASRPRMRNEKSPRFQDYRFGYHEENKEPLSDHFYFLCDAIVYGYALKEREWVVLDIDLIEDVKIDPDPFEYLFLESDIKNTIESVLWSYTAPKGIISPWSKTFIKDKGDGQVFLLHGSPGVGKTCTAECVADLTQRPLLPLTCGDLGANARDVQRTLESFFDLGERWGGVILLDEADVYLEQRSHENLERNSLVSVFLRALEYFQGVLFLTSNRVGCFDDAFISRIHIALYYKKLDDNARRIVWGKNFNRLKKETNVQVELSTEMIAMDDPYIKSVEWNGREIRNAFQTAVALAKREAHVNGKPVVTLEISHIRRVVALSKGFKQYMDSTHKHLNEADRAAREEFRNDAFAG